MASKKTTQSEGTLDQVEKARAELFVMRTDLHLRKLKNTRSIFLKRKEIARMLTKLNIEKGVNK